MLFALDANGVPSVGQDHEDRHPRSRYRTTRTWSCTFPLTRHRARGRRRFRQRQRRHGLFRGRQRGDQDPEHHQLDGQRPVRRGGADGRGDLPEQHHSGHTLFGEHRGHLAIDHRDGLGDRDDLDNNVGILTHDYPAMFFGFHNSLYKWEFGTSSGGGDCYSGYSPAGQWVHIAATYDGTTARLFANGVELCTQAVSGDIVFDTSTPNFSSFVSSGFYETRDPDTNIVLISNNYNESGVTDEIKGRVDELKIYDKAWTGTAIKALYDAGVAQGVPSCPPGTITAEYRIDNGPWTAGNAINAAPGAQVDIRAQTSGAYFVTTAQNDNDSPTFQSGVDFTQADGYTIDPATDIGANQPAHPHHRGRMPHSGHPQLRRRVRPRGRADIGRMENKQQSVSKRTRR